MRGMADKKDPNIEAGAEQDVLVFVGPSYDKQVLKALALVNDCTARAAGLLLIIATFGGSAHAAYKLASTLRQLYGKITVFVPSLCKSAGTLVCLAADELVMSLEGELGPLDVQVLQQDSRRYRSGLDQVAAFSELEDHTLRAFAKYFSFFSSKEGLKMKTDLAAKTAAALAGMTMEQLFCQIDPRMVGEIAREMQIAARYGDRIATDNVRQQAIDVLVKYFPSHRFVIDYREASLLFSRVRKPTSEENQYVKDIDFLDVLNSERSVIKLLPEGKHEA